MKPLTEENFDSTVTLSELVLVDFWADWCGPCKKLTPILEALEQKFQGRATFCTVDVGQYSSLAAAYGIRGIPTVLIFKAGVVVGYHYGLKSPQEYTDSLNQAIKNL